MSGLDSWEDDPSAQDENLTRQTQQSLNVGANTFQPGAQSFQPGQQYQQYGAFNQPQHNQYYNQQQPYAGGYPQYGQQNYGQYGQQANYNSNYNPVYGGQYDSYGQQQSFQQPQQRQVPVIAKRPTASDNNPNGPTPPTSMPVTSSNGSLPQPKAETVPTGTNPSAPKTKVLSIGVPTAPAPSAKKDDDKAAPSAVDGAKVIAAKAIEKTEKPAISSNGKSSPTTSGTSSPTPGETKAEVRKADAVAEEQAEYVDEEILDEVYGKEHVNLIFIGHVDAGKSTLGGSILYATGMVDERTMDKYKRDAKEAGRESWYLSWALDLTKQERDKGKTVEVGRGFFETERRRYTILDAPGHKNYVPNMIGGASQADVGVLVISARKGEYETGFEKGGQTREHAMLAKTQGVNQLVVVINKMDDPTVEWSQDRYKECTNTLIKYLKGLGYGKDDVTFMPISAQTAVGLKDRVPKKLAPWYDGPSLLEYLDNLKTLERKRNAPFMMPVSTKYRDMGTVIEGKIEAGRIKKGDNCILMPNRDNVTVTALYGETEEEIAQGDCGDQVRIRLRGVEEEDIMPGFVLCSTKRPVHTVSAFEAQVVLLELRNIVTAGFECVLHVHSAIEEVQFGALLHKLEKGTGRKSKKPPTHAVKGQSIIARLEVVGGAGAVCVERFEDYAQMGRFTLRDQVWFLSVFEVEGRC